MKNYQQKSFGSDGGHARYDRTGGVAYSHQHPVHPGAIAVWVLRRLALVIERLFVNGKYQFYKKTAVAPSALRVPVVKLAIVGGFAFFVFRNDTSVNMGMGARQRADMGGRPVAETVAYEEPPATKSAWGGLTALFEQKDYFADEPGDDDETRRVKSYIRRFKDVAVSESEHYDIPASIKMAQGILETNAGTSSLAKKNNNHFGVKCFSRTCKKGHCSNFGDDSHKDFFRKYGNAWESWRAHSKMIVTGKYKTLLKYGDDYKKWAHGLKKLGYATAKHYDQTLIELIEKYHLDELDN
ncbi:MAG: glucosaminidase domain-containing protein [Bacteroidetes bacterium]|nr:glucosaminidase domain-containing protein [Bacteroidota bacterium]